MRRAFGIGLLACALLVLGVSVAGGESGGGKPALASASAFATRGADGVARGSVSVNGNGARGGDGTSASASTTDYRGHATARASARDVRLFGGLVTAKRLTVTASADGSGNTETRGAVVGLLAAGRSIPSATQAHVYPLGDYGRLYVLRRHSGAIEALRAILTKDYKSYPAGSISVAGFASASASDGTPPPPPPPKKPPKRDTEPSPSPAPEKPPHKKPKHRKPSRVHVLATADNFVFPIYGKYALADGFTGTTSGHLAPGCVGPHAGDDIFADSGTPLVAVTDGTIEHVGTLPCAGNRLWLRSKDGDTFFYAHLSTFAKAAQNGAHVSAGEVIGFVGNTGQAEDRPPHLHFEVHPGDGDAVDPYPFLKAWENRRDVPAAAWVRENGEVATQPGTLVVVKDYLSR